MEINPFSNLLAQIQTFNKKNEKIAQQNGENFNIFRILKIETSEVRLHSKFLGELLNPRGSHGQKDLFLKLFINAFQFKNNDFEPLGAHIKFEKYTGLISEDGNEGGRIDLIITDRTGKHIIIENKIYAKDQDKQLIRYNTYSPHADLFYLTLDGKSPHPESCGGLVENEHFRCISYKNHIITWLEECRKAVDFNPIVRESIAQYINLIKYLNKQPINKAMTEELNDIISSNLEAAFTIQNNLQSATKSLLKKLKKEVFELEEDFQSLGFSCYYYLDINEPYSGFRFRKEEWEFVDIAFQLGSYGKFFIYGLATINDPKDVTIPATLKQALEDKSKTKVNEPWWPVKIKPEPPFDKNWSISYEPWEAISNGAMKEIIRKQINEMIALIGDIKL